MPLQETSGNVTADAYGGGVAAVPNYIEQVFSTYLYTGNGSTQTITNGIDLAGKGGLTWIKERSAAADNQLIDTVRGATYKLVSNTTGAQSQYTTGLTSFNSDGFSISTNTQYNASGQTYVSWTFRKQPKFFDVVTYTGTGSSTQSISTTLGVAPSFVIIKKTSASDNWKTFARVSNTTWTLVYLNLTNAGSNFAYSAISPALSTTAVDVGYISTNIEGGCNDSGATYVMYLFAHDAGGFGLTGTDNVISCGSFTTSGTAPNNATVNLGYEPQFLLYKISSSTGDWRIVDNMRGFLASGGSPTSPQLRPNLSNAEQNTSFVQLTSTGFTTDTGVDAQTYIYIAIRRGPMKVPTDATKVFAPAIRTGTGSAASVTSAGFPIDLIFSGDRTVARGFNWDDRLSGAQQSLRSWSTAGYTSDTQGVTGFDSMTGMSLGDGSTFGGGYNVSGENYVYQMLRRAPSFFDEVCYTGTGTQGQNIPHSLGVAPELQIIKKRSAADSWYIRASSQATWKYLNFSTQAEQGTNNTVFPSNSTSTNIVLGDDGGVNASGATYVAYLFATCAGVSKVGSYTGNGGTQAISCGFAGGARFVLIKRTDSTGDWYVYDTARGMTVLTDPYLLLNSTAAESATLGSVTSTTGGFTVNASILAAINTNGASYIFLAIA